MAERVKRRTNSGPTKRIDLDLKRSWDQLSEKARTRALRLGFDRQTWENNRGEAGEPNEIDCIFISSDIVPWMKLPVVIVTGNKSQRQITVQAHRR